MPCLTCLRSEEQSELVDKVGSLIRVNHWLLCALGVGHPALATVYDLSNEADLACKLTGAGGGGCAITLLESASRTDPTLLKLRADLKEKGFVSFFSEVGGAGVKWHEVFPL